jgi:hypothetical protein
MQDAHIMVQCLGLRVEAHQFYCPQSLLSLRQGAKRLKRQHMPLAWAQTLAQQEVAVIKINTLHRLPIEVG